jgi:hypothetical protein
MAEVCTSDSVVENLEMDYTINGDGRENRILCPSKLELILASTFATLGPRVRPPHGQPVEMTFICEDQLFREVVGIDNVHENGSILLIFLHHRPCDLPRCECLS